MARVNSHSFELIVLPTDCWRCQRPTKAGALVAPVGALVEGDSDDDSIWAPLREAAPLLYIEHIPVSIASELITLLPTMRRDRDERSISFLINHCSWCDIRIGDFFLHLEPDGPFFSWPPAAHTETYVISGGQIVCNAPYQ